MFYEHINSASKDFPFLVHHNNIKYIPHLHNETELVYVEEGEIELTLGHNISLLKKGEIAIIPCKIIHNLYTKENSKTFVMKLFPVVNLEEISLKQYVLSKNDNNYSALLNIITEIINEEQKKQSDYKFAINICSQQIFLFILRNLTEIKNDNKEKVRILKESKFLKEVNKYLEENYKKGISLVEIAKHFNLTKSYFCRYFKAVTGTSLWNYYTLFRLEKAIALINSGENKTLTTIAFESGFNNVRSFNTAFKEYQNQTPGEYKKQQKLK